MEIEIRDSDEFSEVPYKELYIAFDVDFEITFRAYPKRVFVAYEDNRDNWSSGADLLDCWVAPAVIIEKTPKTAFNPRKSFGNALDFFFTNGVDKWMVDKWYSEIEKAVMNWAEAGGVTVDSA